jgi:serine/threonine protein kinase/serine/threonine protein phosphatase PrpC
MNDLQNNHPTPFNSWADNQTQLSCESLLVMLSSVTSHLEELHKNDKAHGGITADSLLISPETKQIDLNRFKDSKVDYIKRTPYSPLEASQDQPVAASVSGDIYSLAAVLYHALYGHPPAAADARSTRGQPLAFTSQFVTPAVQDALNQALDLDPAKRPTSITELETLLRRPADQALQNTQPAQQFTPAPAPAKSPAPLEPPVPKSVERVPMNLTKGKPCEIPASSLFPDGCVGWQVTFTNLEELGLRLDEAAMNIVGIAIVDGEHMIKVQLFRTDELSDRPKLERSIKVTINPDPAAIWKNLPSNQDDPYWKADTDKIALPTPGAFIVAASVRGRSHAQEGLFRDDEFRISYESTTGWHFLTVADGAGSAKLSRRGSHLACAHALKHLEEQLREEADEQGKLTIAKQATNDFMTEDQARSLAYNWLGGAAHSALKAITDEASAQVPPRIPKEYATTLLLSAARQTQRGWIVLSFGIGDGGIGLLQRDGSVQVMSTPDSGEYSSETIFLTSKSLWMTTEGISQRLHVALVPDFHALVLMTDGITDPLFPTEVSLGDKDVWLDFWTELWKQAQITPDNAQACDELLKWSHFYSKGNHDDRTIALLLPQEIKPDAT